MKKLALCALLLFCLGWVALCRWVISDGQAMAATGRTAPVTTLPAVEQQARR